MKKWIVTAADKGDTTDGKARVLKVCNSREEAESYIHDDIKSWISSHKDMDEGGVIYDYDEMNAYVNDSDVGCEWNLEEVEIPC